MSEYDPRYPLGAPIRPPPPEPKPDVLEPMGKLGVFRRNGKAETHIPLPPSKDVSWPTPTPPVAPADPAIVPEETP